MKVRAEPDEDQSKDVQLVTQHILDGEAKQRGPERGNCKFTMLYE
jgi:hypothetical protein